MFLPHTFEVKDLSIIKAFMLSHSFAQLITNVNGVPFASHIPLLLDHVGINGRLLGHVAKANNQWTGFDGKTDALVVFSGPHAYISPNWYANENLVPTWNYVSVHAFGKPNVISNPKVALVQADEDTYVATQVATNLFNKQKAAYIVAVARLAQYVLSEGRAEVTEMRDTGQQTFNESIRGWQDTQEVVRLLSPISPLDATVEQTTYSDDGTPTVSTVTNPLIVTDVAERADAQTVVDNTPQPVKDSV